jgi:GTPase involved in cell partitioning and DNA repair
LHLSYSLVILNTWIQYHFDCINILVYDYLILVGSYGNGQAVISSGKLSGITIYKSSNIGKGLGIRFLRHIERNPVLLFLIPADSNNHREEFEILKNELREYNPELLDKKFIIAISKSDMLDDELKEAIEKLLPEEVPHVFISSITNQGLVELKDILCAALNQEVIVNN